LHPIENQLPLLRHAVFRATELLAKLSALKAAAANRTATNEDVEAARQAHAAYTEAAINLGFSRPGNDAGWNGETAIHQTEEK
jgi:hypothetical protein